MEKFASERDITLKKTPPLHPQSNPAETFMKPLGKTMKIATQNNEREDKALTQLLHNYRDTPHPSTNVAPGAMLFRDGYRNTFPRISVSPEDIQKAKNRDRELKEKRETKVNASKYRKQTKINVGDRVLVRNFTRKSKFEPLFPQVIFEVIDISRNNTVVTVKREGDDRLFRRHPDDVKVVNGLPPQATQSTHLSESDQLFKFHKMFTSASEDDGDLSMIFSDAVNDKSTDEQPAVPDLRRSERTPQPNPRYYNSDLLN